MNKYILLLSIVSLVVLTSGCTIPLPWETPQNNTQPNTTVIVQDNGDGSSNGGKTVNAAAQDCLNCGYYPWYKGTRCPECGYGDNDGILNCPKCGQYAFHGSSWANGHCTSCGYKT